MQPWIIEKVKQKEKQEPARERLRIPIEIWEDILEWDELKEEEEPKRGVCVIYEGEEESED